MADVAGPLATGVRPTKELLLGRLRKAAGPDGYLWISVNRNIANNVWASKTALGKTLNVAFSLTLLALPVFWWRWGWLVAGIAALTLFIENRIISSMAMTYVRRLAAQDLDAMDLLYQEQVVILEWRDPDRSPAAADGEIWARFLQIVPILDRRGPRSIQEFHEENEIVRKALWDGRAWDYRRGPWWQPLLEPGELPPEPIPDVRGETRSERVAQNDQNPETTTTGPPTPSAEPDDHASCGYEASEDDATAHSAPEATTSRDASTESESDEYAWCGYEASADDGAPGRGEPDPFAFLAEARPTYEQALERLVSLQGFDGDWRPGRELAICMGKHSWGEMDQALKEATLDSKDSGIDHYAGKALATALALRWLDRTASHDRDRWAHVVEKAEGWLAKYAPTPPGSGSWKTLADELLR